MVYLVRFRYPPNREIHNTLVIEANSERHARKLANAILKDPGGPWSFFGSRPRIAWIDTKDEREDK